MKKEFKH